MAVIRTHPPSFQYVLGCDLYYNSYYLWGGGGNRKSHRFHFTLPDDIILCGTLVQLIVKLVPGGNDL